MAKRPKQEEIPMAREGVAAKQIPKLENLGDDFIEKRDAKATLAEEMTAIETEMLELMGEHGITRYRFGDQELVLKPRKNHVKANKVNVEGQEDAPDE